MTVHTAPLFSILTTIALTFFSRRSLILTLLDYSEKRGLSGFATREGNEGRKIRPTKGCQRTQTRIDPGCCTQSVRGRRLGRRVGARDSRGGRLHAGGTLLSLRIQGSHLR